MRASLHRRAVCAALLCSILALGAKCPIVDQADLEAKRLGQQVHVLDRMGYGPDAWSLARIQELGVNGYLAEQLAPETIEDSAFEARVAGPWTDMTYAELLENYPNTPPPGCTGVCIGDHLVREAQKAKILRAVYSRRQLEAVLTDFWFDHFNIDATNHLMRWDIIPYLRDAIRPHVLGNFVDMLDAVARSPGMLDYLDNMLNFKDG